RPGLGQVHRPLSDFSGAAAARGYEPVRGRAGRGGAGPAGLGHRLAARESHVGHPDAERRRAHGPALDLGSGCGRSPQGAGREPGAALRLLVNQGDGAVGANTSRPLNELTATEIVAGVTGGEFTCEAVLAACLERIKAREADVKAWTAIDQERALATAR